MANPAWERSDVSGWSVHSVEKAATSVATWLIDPDTGDRWLHKDTVVPTNGFEQGEDWSELVSTSIAQLLGVPCADTRLCLRHGKRGSLSKDVNIQGHSLYNGYVVLEECPDVADYFPHMEGAPGVDPERPLVKRPGHRLDNIQTALNGAVAPSSFSGPAALDAFDVFVGYLMLDALIANRDRHEQNWAVLTPGLTTLPVQLAPSYDHATSLGYNLTDDRRQGVLKNSAALAKWASAGTAWRFEHEGNAKRAQTLVDLAVEALELASDDAAAHWSAQLHLLAIDGVIEELADGAIPAMSVDASKFACELINHNLERMTDVI